MKKLFLATSALTFTLLSAPSFAADSTADLNRKVQALQDQLRAIQQQLDAQKATDAAQTDALAKEATTREAIEKAARDINLEQGGHTVYENGIAVSVPPVPAPAPKVVVSGANKFSLESADGQYSIALTGRIHIDEGGYFNFKPDSTLTGTQKLTSGFNARRARIGVTGKVAGDWTYTFVYDGGNSQDNAAKGIQSAQITYNGFKDVIIDLPGYSEPPFTLETATSSNDIIFMERASPSNVATSLNAGDFRINTGVRFIDDRYWLGAYFTGPAQGDTHGNGTNNKERFGAFQRASVQALVGPNYSVHIGGSLDELLQAPNATVGGPGAITLSDPPELRVDASSLLSTGGLGTVANPVTGAFIYNGEFAAGYDNFFFQGEYDHYSVNRLGLATANFWGTYGMVSWVLTGEHRNYNRATGAYGSITPRENFSISKGGIGAWELAARVSYTDLVDHYAYGTALAAQPNAVNGGIQTNYTVGVNWYLNTYMRMMFNYIHSDMKKINGAAIGATPAGAVGVPIGDSFNAIAARMQLAW